MALLVGGVFVTLIGFFCAGWLTGFIRGPLINVSAPIGMVLIGLAILGTLIGLVMIYAGWRMTSL